MELPAAAARAFLLPVVPICLYVAWSDMARMRIPNVAVVALVGVFAILGAVVLPPHLWAWQWLSLVMVLGAGFVLSVAGLVGAGDAKFAAAAALFVAPGDTGLALTTLAGALLASLATHRAARGVAGIRRVVPDWRSWTHEKFPMGLPLAGTLILYLSLAALRPA